MSRLLDVDIDSMITDYELSYKNTNDNFTNQFKRLNDQILQLYTHKMEEQRKILIQQSDVNRKITENHEKLQCIAEKLEREQQILNTENSRLESITNESRQLEVEENSLNDLINKTKMEQTNVYSEKKETIKKFKREINAFKHGINMYEKYLQLSMDIKNEDKCSSFSITMKSLKHHINYNIIFEEIDNNFKLIDVMPHNQSVIKAAELYNQNNDIQGLLAFLFQT